MAEKKYITVSLPSVPFFYSTDPALAGKNTPNDKVMLYFPFEGLDHLLSDRPLFRPTPRPKIETPHAIIGDQPGFRFIPYPDKPPETKPE